MAKAWQSWTRIDGDHEAYVRRIIVNEFASGWRRRWRGELPTAGEELREDEPSDLTGSAREGMFR